MRRPSPIPVAVAASCLLAAGLVAGAVTGASAATSASSATGPTGSTASRPTSVSGRYVVLYGSDVAAARRSLAKLGARIVRENTAIGVATVQTADRGFLRAVSREKALAGAAEDVVIGRAPGAGTAARAGHPTSGIARERAESRAGVLGRATTPSRAVTASEPLATHQWDMRMLDATPGGSYRVQPGKRGVTVGIIDTGVDGSHPDIAPNFDSALSRNFVTDIPVDSSGLVLDGPCEHPSCVDPVDEDDDGHGTHVASTIGSPINGIGIAGVAPGVRLVNIRAGQDSGYFFLQPTLDALTYAGQAGIDVVNMSFFTDPWLFNCRANPADSASEQAQQATIIEATQRAVRYARARGVTLVAASGNESTDLGNPTVDSISPDYPQAPGTARTRTIDNTCLTMPTEANGVIVVNAVGPSGRLSYYSNYGVEQTNVAAPGGDRREFYGTPYYNAPDTRILAAYPMNVGLANGTIDPTTLEPTTPLVLRDCSGAVCAYWQYIQGTSMASPHAAGVAALIVSKFGTRDRVYGGLTLAPAAVQARLQASATKRACPDPNPFSYDDPALAGYHPVCAGSAAFNGFFGHGVVNALRAVK